MRRVTILEYAKHYPSQCVTLHVHARVAPGTTDAELEDTVRFHLAVSSLDDTMLDLSAVLFTDANIDADSDRVWRTEQDRDYWVNEAGRYQFQQSALLAALREQAEKWRQDQSTTAYAQTLDEIIEENPV